MTITTERPDLRGLTDDELAGLYESGSDDDRAAILAEAARRDRADRARQARQAVSAQWYDAAFAAYLLAEQECKGRLLSAEGDAHGPADPFSLWRMPERQALRFASEELRNHWLEHPRLTRAEYRRQLAAANRAARDERDAAAGITEPEPKPEPWQRVPGGAVRPAEVAIGSLTVAAWTALDPAGTITLHPSRDRAAAWLSPAPEPPPAPVPGPAVAPGAAARYSAALGALTGQVDNLAAHVLAARGRINGGNHR